ncbi:glycosyltransferase family 39 protein [Patescibacteria group bacterium]|nr:glycosyltransferase family 39 protein [Patescibacteria group bacterium]
MTKLLDFVNKYRFKLVVLAVIFQAIILAQTRFTAWPEMLLWPYLILKGWLPYKDIAIAHTPLLFTDLSVFYKFFGLGLLQLKIYTWIIILFTDGILYFVVKKLWGIKVARVSLLVYIPLQLFYDGNGLWFDLVLAPLALLIYYCLRKQKYLWAGIWWAIAFLTKQTAFWFLVPVFILLVKENLFKGLKDFGKGVLIIFVPTLLIIYFLGIYPDFYYWTFKFAIGILPTASGQVLFPSIKQLLVAVFPIVLLFLARLRLHKPSTTLILWAVFGIFGVYPRWELFHFQPGLPFLAIGLALMLLSFSKMKVVEKSVLLIALALFLIIIARQTGRAWKQTDRFFEPQILQTSTYIKNNTSGNGEIYVLNTWDNIYVLSDRLPATRPWIPQLSWYIEIPGVQERMVSELSLNRPKMIVVGQYSEMEKWVYKPKQILEFISRNYRVKDKIGDLSILILK